MEWPILGREAELARLTAGLERGTGSLIVGTAGVGKTRLMTELLARASDTGKATYRVAGSATTNTVPFGAVAGLLPDAGIGDATWLLRNLTAGLARMAQPHGLVLGVDDLDLLDPSTIAVIRRAAEHPTISVVATMRADAAGNPTAVDLWKDGLVERVDIGDLGRPDVIRLAEAMFGGRLSVGLGGELWAISRGNPLFLRELVQYARDSDLAVWHGEYWDLTAPLALPHHVTDLMQQRLAGIAGDERTALATVALTEPLPLAIATGAVSREALAGLEQQGIVQLDELDGRPMLRTSHPLLGEAVRARVGPLRRQEVLVGIADAAGADGATPADALLIASWLLDASQPVPAAVALPASMAALHRQNAPLAETLARRATAEHPTAQGLVVLGRSLYMQSRQAEAEAVLTEAAHAATTHETRALVGSALAEMYVFGHADGVAAQARVGKILEEVEEPGARIELEAHASLAAGLAGDFRPALDRGADLLAEDLPATAAVPLSMVYTLAQAITGRLDGVFTTIDRAEVLLDAVRHEYPMARDQLGLNRVLALHAAGRLSDAHTFVDATIGADDFPARITSAWLYIGALVQFVTGDLDTAVARTKESVEQHRIADPIGTKAMSLGLHAVARAMRGDLAAAQAAIDEAADDPLADPIRAQVFLRLAEAWIQCRQGAPDAAAGLATTIGQAAVDQWHVVWGAVALHDAVRFGYPGPAAGPLDELGESAGPLVGILARHARAAADDDPLGLEKVAAEFETIGALAAAADAWAARALLPPPGGAIAAVRSHELAGACPGYTPPLHAAVANPLSDRQLEIARHAAIGLTTKEIAERLFITAKTVDNHLLRAYRALGIAGRDELAAAIPPGLLPVTG